MPVPQVGLDVWHGMLPAHSCGVAIPDAPVLLQHGHCGALGRSQHICGCACMRQAGQSDYSLPESSLWRCICGGVSGYEIPGTDTRRWMVCAPGMEQPANQPSLLSLTADTVGHTTLKSLGFPSGPASSMNFWMTSYDGQTLRFLHEQAVPCIKSMRHVTGRT